MKESLVTVIYPCYNQPHILAASLRSLVNQTRKDFAVLLVDDCSIMDYDDVIAAFPQLRITRVVNEKNLGAVPNMLNCLRYPVSTPYKMVFHEDDLLHPQWLELAIPALQKCPGAAWVASNMSFFKDNMSVHFNAVESLDYHIKNDINELVAAIVEGQTFSFASVLYDSNIAAGASMPFDTYSMLSDRYMLLEMGKKCGFIYFKFDFVAAFDHSGRDTRWRTMTKSHIENYLLYLKSYFTAKQLRQKNIHAGFTRTSLSLLAILPAVSLYQKICFYFRFYAKGLFSLKYFLLSFGSVRHFSDFFKKQ
jgi:glycosyltransferase involved in cell wall biosynthesis